MNADRLALATIAATAIAGLYLATPDTPPTAVTDEHGRYTLTVPNPPECEDSTLTITYPPPTGAVSSLDAAKILSAVVGGPAVDENACDVDEDGRCSALDAAHILRYMVGRENASTGQWRPKNAIVRICPGQSAVADVKAYVLGDVTGNWRPEP
jgi:hypothetical protein